jgi:cobalt-zinc-cadmium efflux system membrane fusion protein
MRKAFVLFVVILTLWGCTKSQEPAKDNPKNYSKDNPTGMKVETYKVSSQEVTSSIEATGSIQPDTEGTAKVVSVLAGTVENIFVKVGDAVKIGTPLVSVRSADVSDAYSNYLSNLSQVKQAERICNLNKQLFEVGAVTKNDLMASEANCEQLKALSDAYKRKLEIYGVNVESGFTDRHLIKSPMSGAVVEIQSHIGDRVDTSNPLMTVANPSKVMVVANIYDTEISNIQKGKDVHFSTDIFPDALFNGVVTNISDASDPDSKTIKTYIRITGGPHLFKQNMFLKLKILNGKKRFPVVPKTALLYKDGKFTVYLSVGGKVELKEVKPSFDVSEKMIAVEGLKDGDEVVLSAIALEKT